MADLMKEFAAKLERHEPSPSGPVVSTEFGQYRKGFEWCRKVLREALTEPDSGAEALRKALASAQDEARAERAMQCRAVVPAVYEAIQKMIRTGSGKRAQSTGGTWRSRGDRAFWLGVHDLAHDAADWWHEEQRIEAYSDRARDEIFAEWRAGHRPGPPPGGLFAAALARRKAGR